MEDPRIPVVPLVADAAGCRITPVFTGPIDLFTPHDLRDRRDALLPMPEKGCRMTRSGAVCGPPGEAVRTEKLTPLTASDLYERYQEEVFHYISRRIAQREEAEDVTVETFAAAFAALPRFRGACPPRLWLLSIARRKVVDVLRRRGARAEVLESEVDTAKTPLPEVLCPDEGPEAVVQRAETVRMLRGLMMELKEEQREALLLQYVEELPITEIATVMGRSPAAVNSLLQRGRASLLRRGGRLLSGEEVSR